MIKFWVRLEKTNNNLLKEALSLSKSLDEEGVNSWFSCINSILSLLNVSPKNVLKDKINVKNLCIKKLTDLYSRIWKEDLFNDSRKDKNHKNKLRTFRLFKTCFKFEPYISQASSLDRNTLCKFRIGLHSLEIEIGRHRNIPVEDRKCRLCKLDVEDEVHFLLNCPLLNSVRDPVLKNVIMSSPNLSSCNATEKFIWLLSNESPEIIKLLANLIRSLFVLRTSLLGA